MDHDHDFNEDNEDSPRFLHHPDVWRTSQHNAEETDHSRNSYLVEEPNRWRFSEISCICSSWCTNDTFACFPGRLFATNFIVPCFDFRLSSHSEVKYLIWGIRELGKDDFGNWGNLLSQGREWSIVVVIERIERHDHRWNLIFYMDYSQIPMVTNENSVKSRGTNRIEVIRTFHRLE